MSENKITFPVKLASNNPQSFGIVDATEVSGHRSVDTISELYAISDSILSILKDGSDAIGQEWFVVSEDCKYRLDNWANRKSVAGWTKLPKQELINTKQSVSEKDQPNGYAGLDSNGKLPIEKTYGDTATVVDVETYESLPVTGLSGVIYYVSNTSAQYKWSGSAYIDITDGADNAKKNETSIFDCSNGTSTKYYSSLLDAINIVPPVYRTSNRIISYLSTENATTKAVNYQYHGIDSTTWTDLTKWERVPNQSDLTEIRSDLTETTDKLIELGDGMKRLIGEEALDIDVTPSDYTITFGYDISDEGKIVNLSNYSYRYEPINLSNYVGRTVTIKIPGGSGTRKQILGDENYNASQYDTELSIKNNGGVTFEITETYHVLYLATHQGETGLTVLVHKDAKKGEIDNIKENAGDLSKLSTEDKISLVNAINELDSRTSAKDIVHTPFDFGWQNHPLINKIERTKDGISINFDVSIYKPTGKTYYVSPTGNNSNSGLSPDQPLTNISTAIAKLDAKVIVLLDGWYDANRLAGLVEKGIAIVAYDNAKPVLYSGSNYSDWSLVDGKSNTYKRVIVNNYGYIIDSSVIDENGDYLRYTKVLSIDEVELVEGSSFSDNNYIYVHPNIGSNISQDVKVIWVGFNIEAHLSGNELLYLEGLTIIGGGYACCRLRNMGNERPLLCAKNCTFDGGIQQNSFYMQGADSILQNCVAIRAFNDGFNYHGYEGKLCNSIEINCIGRQNGYEGGETNNGSTSHDGSFVIRVNCKYYDNCGPNMAEAGDGTQSWNIGCRSYNTVRATTNPYACSNATASDGSAKMWIDTCSLYGTAYDIIARNGATVYVHNSIVSKVWDGYGQGLSWAKPIGHIIAY